MYVGAAQVSGRQCMSRGDSDAGDVRKKSANCSLFKFEKSASCNSVSILYRLHSGGWQCVPIGGDDAAGDTCKKAEKSSVSDVK